MAFEDLEAEIGLLLGRVNDAFEDKAEIYERLREMLNEMRAMGMRVPDDLKTLEAQLHDELFGPSEEGAT